MAGYRLAMIWAGAGALWIAAASETPNAELYQYAAWRTAYLVMALSMLPGMLTGGLSREPAPRPLAPARNAAEWLQSASGGTLCRVLQTAPLACGPDPGHCAATGSAT